MSRMIAMAMRDQNGGYAWRRFSPDRFEPLNELAVGKPGIDQDARRPGLQKKRVPVTPASQNGYPHAPPRAQLGSLGKTLHLQLQALGARVPAWATPIWNMTV